MYWFIKSDARPGIVPAIMFRQECRYQLRFTAAARGDCCAGFVYTMPNAGSELAGNNRRHNAGPGLFQDSVSWFIERARFSLVLAATVASKERDKARLNNPQRMTIPARAPGRASGHRWERFGYWLPGGAGAELRQVRDSNRIAMGFRNRLQRIVQCLPPETVIFSFGRGVVAFHDER